MTDGWIKTHRSLLDDPIMCKDAHHLAIWTWLCLRAAYTEGEAWFKNAKRTLHPGELITGRKRIAEALKINESKVQRVLKLFEEQGLIRQEMSNQNRLITIVAWSEYQATPPEETSEPQDPPAPPKAQKTPQTTTYRQVVIRSKTPVYYAQNKVPNKAPKPAENGSKSEQPTTPHSPLPLRRAKTSDWQETIARIKPTEPGSKKYETPPKYLPPKVPKKRATSPSTCPTAEQPVNTNKESKNIRNNNNSNKKRERREQARFSAPSLSEVKSFIQEKQYNVSPEVWFAYYESTNWHQGKSPMKNWQSAVALWHFRELEKEKKRDPARSVAYAQRPPKPMLNVNDIWKEREIQRYG